MKKTLTLILTVITVGCYAQMPDSVIQKLKVKGLKDTMTLKGSGTKPMEKMTLYSGTIGYSNLLSKPDSLFIKPAYLAQGVLPFSGNSVYSMGNKTLYSIKADGTIELGELIIEAVIKALEKKGYYLNKAGGSVTSFKRSHLLKQ